MKNTKIAAEIIIYNSGYKLEIKKIYLENFLNTVII